jgi:hypothetical protein
VPIVLEMPRFAHPIDARAFIIIVPHIARTRSGFTRPFTPRAAPRYTPRMPPPPPRVRTPSLDA